MRQLGEDFGTPNPLEHDLRYLLETGDYADAALVFTVEGTNDYSRQDSSNSEYGFRPKLELPCHKAILSARSPFFRSLIARRTRNIDEYVERSIHIPTRIVLDETVIPKRYARVLLHAIYLDTVDLSLILRGAGTGNSAGSLGEVHALTNTGRVRPTTLEEAMELYQIGRFLELDILAQGCEDLILEWLSLDTLSTVLKWGCQPYGSAWIFRQACQYLREEFAAVSASPVLCQLDKAQLVHVLESNFLQASELEVLQAVLKWGEQELIRRMEDREPNLLSHTAHSVARKGVKKRDLSDVELREILSELLPLVRMDHVLPPNSEILCQAIRRGLVSTPPSHMIGDERENLRVNAWVRGGKNQRLFVRPRLFMPYFEEVKALLEDRIASSHHQVELMRMRRSRQFSDIPDTLYMVSRMNDASHNIAGVSCGIRSYDHQKSNPTTIPPPDNHTLMAMRKRENKLRQSPMCQRALLLPLSSKHEIDRQIRLRVVREFNLPDEVSDILENSSIKNQGGSRDKDECNDVVSTEQPDECLLEDEDQSPPPSPAAADPARTTAAAATFMSTSSMASSSSSACGTDGVQLCYNRNLTFPRQQPGLLGVATLLAASSGSNFQSSYARITASVHHRNELPALITEGDFRFPHGNALNVDRGGEAGACGLDSGNGHLSDMMPDVAMATASLGQLHLNAGGVGSLSSRVLTTDMPESLQLDLGDGPTPHIISNGAGVINLRNLQVRTFTVSNRNIYIIHLFIPFSINCLKETITTYCNVQTHHLIFCSRVNNHPPHSLP